MVSNNTKRKNKLLIPVSKKKNSSLVREVHEVGILNNSKTLSVLYCCIVSMHPYLSILKVVVALSVGEWNSQWESLRRAWCLDFPAVPLQVKLRFMIWTFSSCPQEKSLISLQKLVDQSSKNVGTDWRAAESSWSSLDRDYSQPFVLRNKIWC